MKKYIFIAASIMVAALCFVFCKKATTEVTTVKTEEVIAVTTLPLQSTNGTGILEATGLVNTANEARYSFKIGGVIERIYVQEGQSFAKGALLARLKPTEIESGVEQARIGLEKARRDHQRISNLYRDSVATLEQFQNTKSALDLAQQQLESVQFNQQYAQIYATQAGFVTKKLANEGEIIGGGFPVLAVNETGQNAWVLRVGLSDKDWALTQEGQRATVRLDAFPGKTFKAILSKKLLAADQGSGSLQVELRLETAGAKLALGMYGTAQIETGAAASQFVRIPYDALIEADGYHAFVFVPVTDHSVKKMPIVIRHFDDKAVEVASGLEGVREIVVSNSAFLNENSTIKIQR
jgi:RND family efflux transporter MFP subunit